MTPPNKGQKYPAEVLTAAEVAALLGAVPRTAARRHPNRALSRCCTAGPHLRDPRAAPVRRQPAQAHDPRAPRQRRQGDHARLPPELRRRAGPLDRHPQGARVEERAAVLHAGRAARSPVSTPVTCCTASADKAGIEKRVHPHGLRHTFAVELEQRRRAGHQISKLLGHSSIAVTSRYLDHLTNAQAVDRARGHRPARARRLGDVWRPLARWCHRPTVECRWCAGGR